MPAKTCPKCFLKDAKSTSYHKKFSKHESICPFCGSELVTRTHQEVIINPELKKKESRILRKGKELGKKKHKFSLDKVFPSDPNEGKEDKRPIHKRKKPRQTIRWGLR
jgi:superfamily II helicase